ncbi:ComF family protein [uncultured Muriicola sp.]|uniref:ComF family protein n=1 Tax=uncultured Muriicola sp. TaxID=1583102 RepID=UPI002626C58D|nr:phosphoribosyltransferase family protein [uncultured Muriicola sp.]
MELTKLPNIINDLNTVLLPRVCFGCNARLYRGEQILCTPCRDQIPLTEFNFTEENSLDRTFYGRITIEKASSFLFFNDLGVVKNLIHYLKYRNQPQIANFIGDWYGSYLKKDKGLPAIDMVLPVPMHPKKLKKRGYNQVEGFGKRLAHHLNAAYCDDILIKTTHTQTQTQKSRIFRWQHQSPSFALLKPHSLAHKKILLVDDVVTTGATLEACVKAINDEINVTIYIATMAMVP